MAVTENFYTGNGSTTSYSFTFPYIDEDDIKVSLDGTLTTAYTLANATTVLFNTAPANGVAIRIYRDTNTDSLKSTFFAGSAIRAQDLNEDFLQNNYAVQEIRNNTWDSETNTIHSDEPWVSSDSQIATTAAIDARFQDELTETITSAEVWPDNDDTVATTAAIDNRVDSKIDAAITGDIATDGTGITITNDGDGTITLGLGTGLIDLDRIKDEDIITYAEQNAGSPSWDSDGRIATTYAAARRFDTLVQTSTPTGSNWAVGKTWLQNDANLTLSVWNGSAWLGIASGGTFTNQPKVVYVDATAGSDANDGHRVSRPKATIKAAVDQINADSTYGEGSVVVVAPGVYQEVAPIDITKKDVSIIGQALRSCIVHPTAATETNSLFRLNSGSYIANLTLTGMKASGTRGNSTIDPGATYGLPENQGWNFSFYPGAMIYKSPYIQNCTNFSDSEINNNSLTPHTPAGGAGGDTDSAMTGGGLLIDGSTPHSTSPLRSMVCDSYTHVGLDGPGILVTNNGYCQATSSYSFFTHYHIKCRNGGQANLAASTTDFGRYSLVADGRSQNAIFTATTTALANSGATTFTIGAPVAGSPWHGTATRPQSNMLVDIGGNTYPILSATANGAGWDVTISRPDPANKSSNLGLNGSVASGSAVSFFLRSMIASSGHTMEYVGSGTNYTALPENGGVPVEANQVIELNDGKIWAAITDHNGKFKLGDTLTVDQQIGFVTIPSGSIAFDLASDGSPQLGANLDVLNRTISSSTGNVVVDDTLDVNSHKVINVTDPTNAQDAATKNYVDTTTVSLSGDTMTGALGITSGSAASPSIYFDTNTGIYSPGADQVAISTNGTGRLFVDSSGRVGIGTTPGRTLDVSGSIRSGGSTNPFLALNDNTTEAYFEIASSVTRISSGTSQPLAFRIGSSEAMRLDSSGRLGLGTSSPAEQLELAKGSERLMIGADSPSGYSRIAARNTANSGYRGFQIDGSDLLINSNTNGNVLVATGGGKVGIGTTSPGRTLDVVGSIRSGGSTNPYLALADGTTEAYFEIASSVTRISSGTSQPLAFRIGSSEAARIDTSNRLLVGTSTSPSVGGHSQYGKIFSAGNTSVSTGAGVISIARGLASSSGFASGDHLGSLCYTDSVGAEFARIEAYADAASGSNDYPGRLVFSVTADGGSSPSEAMRISNSRNTSFTGAILPSSDNAYQCGASGQRWSLIYAANGTIQTSDQRDKTEIAEASLGSDFIKSLKPVSYKFVVGGNKDAGVDEDGNRVYEAVPGKRTHWGFIAQEVKEAADEAGVDFGGWVLTDTENPDSPQGLRYDQFIAPLTKALQEALAEIDILKAKVAALEGA